ncbi:MAG TPA: response regulator [Planctomycetota bacterium]|nr:response regulator [Planctomycetota bacterium]
MEKGTVLVIDDQRDLIELVRTTLEGRGFEVLGAQDGTSGLELARRCHPQLIVLDRMMPGLDGLEVCRSLRQDWFTRATPVLMLTARARVEDRVEGLESGADDYLAKPFELKELVARIEALARRVGLELDSNPLTRLPGNTSITRHLESLFQTDIPFAAIYADLDRFKAYNDRYGYESGDRMIRLLARSMGEGLSAAPPGSRFLGHIGGDDFLAVCPPAFAEGAARATIASFDAASVLLLSREDRERGFLEVLNRRGETERVPLVALTIVAAFRASRQRGDPARLSEVLAELKAHAKRLGGGSKFYSDQRK